MKPSNKKGAKNNNKFGSNPLKLENFCVFQDHLNFLMDLYKLETYSFSNMNLSATHLCLF